MNHAPRHEPATLFMVFASRLTGPALAAGCTLMLHRMREVPGLAASTAVIDPDSGQILVRLAFDDLVEREAFVLSGLFNSLPAELAMVPGSRRLARAQQAVDRRQRQGPARG